MTTQTDKPRFLLLLRQPPGPPPPPEYLQPIMEKFMQWMQGMSAKGMVVATSGLEHTGKVLRGSRGATMTDGPYPESKEIVGGFVLLAADSLEQAVEAARDCPGLDYQMVVEVRPVKH